MARKSRKNTNTKPEKVYKTAIYARLSAEDSQGDSIENQIQFLQDFISHRAYLMHCKTYTDNGISGTVFDRPGLTGLFEDINKGLIDCITVKDLSRLGRNYIETGNCLENIFPYPGVRFISVNDNYDSNFVTQNQALSMSLKSLVHDLYANDISKKISAVLDVKKRKGEFMGKYAPLGYKKSPESKNRLITDDETAIIIKEIFRLRLQGLGCNEIARRLNDKAIPAPSQFLVLKGLTNDEPKKHSLWHASTVMNILKNPIYKGCLVVRKFEKSSPKGKKTPIPAEQRQTITNTHPAIIDEITFDTVQKTFSNNNRFSKSDNSNITSGEKPVNLFKGLAICGYCGGFSVRSSGYFSKAKNKLIYRLYCPNKYKKTDICPSKSIAEDKLAELLHRLLDIFLNLLTDEKKHSNLPENTKLNKEIFLLNKKIRSLDILKNNMYEKLKYRVISIDSFNDFISSYRKKIFLYNSKIICIQKQNMNTDESITEADEIPIRMKLIKNIYLYKGKVKIFFNFSDDFVPYLNNKVGFGLSEKEGIHD